MRILKKWLVLGLLVLLAGAAWSKTYRLGVLVPLSGPRADRGIPMKKAAELFVEQFNQSAEAAGNKLELIVRDDFDDPQKARGVAAEMVKQEGLLAVIGHYYPEIAMATAPVFAEAKIPLISPFVGSQQFLSSSKWTFGINARDNTQGAFMATYVKEVLKKDKVLLIHNPDEFGVGLRDAFLAKAQRLGLGVDKVVELPVNGVPGNWAERQFPDAGKAGDYGVVVALTRVDSGLAMLPQIRQRGIEAPLMAPNTWANVRLLKDIDQRWTRDVYVTSGFVWEIANQKASRFAQAYEKKFAERPSVAAAMTFDATLLAARAIQELEGFAPSVSETSVVREGGDPKRAATGTAIRDYLAGIDWQGAIEGATGLLYFNTANDKTARYVTKYLAEREPIKPVKGGSASRAVPAAEAAPATPAGAARTEDNRSVARDVYVSTITAGRFKIAAVQLTRPREEFVLAQLAERIKEGSILLSDEVPFHIVDVVFVGVDIVRINDVNIKDMQWDVDVFMWFKWVEGRLELKDIEKIFAINAVKEQSSVFMEDLKSPTKYRSYKKRLTLGAPFNLAAFPFDSQTLPLAIAHTNKNSTRLMLVADSRHMDSAPVEEIKPQEWSYLGRTVYSDLHRYDSTFGNPNYRMGIGYKSPIYFSTVNLEVDLKRIIQPYLFTFFLPLVIILGIILLILWVPLDQFAPRINASISGLVGVLVYHMSQKNSFPKVGYTMSADYYFLLAYGFVVAMIVLIIYVQNLQSNGLKDQAKRLNRRLSLAGLAAAVLGYGTLTLLAL